MRTCTVLYPWFLFPTSRKACRCLGDDASSALSSALTHMMAMAGHALGGREAG